MPQVLLDTTYHFSLRTAVRLKFLADRRMQWQGWGVYYCMFSLLISSSLGNSNWPCQTYWTRLHGALS